MKKNENYPKYVQAMRLMDEGKSYNYVHVHLHINYYTLRLIRQSYLLGGELALLKPAYQPLLTPSEKVSVVEEIQKNGLSLSAASLKYNKSTDALRCWIKTYQEHGEAGFIRMRTVKEKKRQITEAELDELEMLRKRNEYLEAENALLKKVKALVEEREARLRAIGRGPSKN